MSDFVVTYFLQNKLMQKHHTTSEEVLSIAMRFSQDQYHIPKILVGLLGNVEAALFLGVLLWNYLNNENVVKNDGWFFHTSSQWERMGITARKRRKFQEQLTELGFVEIKKKGIPAKNHYRLMLDNLVVAITSSSKDSVQSLQNVTTSNNETLPQDVTKSNNIHIINKKEKEKEKTDSLFDEELVLAKLNKTGDYLPPKKKLMAEFNLPEYKAKEVYKKLKVCSNEMRKAALMRFIHNPSAKLVIDGVATATQGMPKNFKLPDSLKLELETLASFYGDITGSKVTLTQQNDYDFHLTRKVYKLEQITFVARNCWRILCETNDPFYSITFDVLLREKTIRRFIQNPLLRKMEDSNT